MSKLKIGVVGCGNISRSHLSSFAAYQERCEVIAVADVVREKAEAAASEFGVSHVCHDLDDLLNRYGDELDAVDLLTPHHLHYDEITRSLEAGLHVLIEKPVCSDLDQCRRLRVALSEHRDLKVCVGYSWRFGFREVSEAIDAGKIGRVFCMEADYSHRVLSEADWPGLAWCRFRINCGPDYGTHATDILVWMMGGDPTEVFAVGNDVAGRTVAGSSERDFEDTYLILFQFRDGGIGKVFMSSGVKVPQTGARIFGTDGTITVDANSGTARAALRRGKTSEEIPVAQGSLHPCPEEIDCFLGSIEDGQYRFPICSAQEAIKDVEAFEAIDRSLMTGTRVRVRS